MEGLYQRIDPMSSCSDRLSPINSMTPCDKVYFLKRNEHLILYTCIGELADTMYAKTGIYPSLTVGTLGVHYGSLTLWDNNLKQWAEALGCPTYDPQKAFLSPCDKIFDGFDLMPECAKVQFIKKNKDIIAPDCIWELHRNMTINTGYGASISWPDIYRHASDTIYDYDIKRWSEYFDCAE